MFKRILCPIDFDDHSLNALRMAVGLAQREQAKVYLLHVVPPTDPIVISSPFAAHRAENYARAELQKIAENELTGVDHEILLRFGSPASEILAAEADTKAELIVVATHGRTGVSHLLIGSVAEKLVRESPCPILTVRMKATHQGTERETTPPAD